ncbi:MAG: hypothetical protein ACE5JI_23160, partial [Acidobacteriota bacterium]
MAAITLGAVAAFLILREAPDEAEETHRVGSVVREDRFAPPGLEGGDLFEAVPYTTWRSFSTEDGLPSNKAFCVRADGERVWVGTDAGLACYSGGQWRRYGVRDGLPSPGVVLSLDVSPRTGDLWMGTMSGLVRLSGGRFDVFQQTNSGWSNDFV